MRNFRMTCIKKENTPALAKQKPLIMCDNVSVERGGVPLFDGLGFSLLEGRGLVLSGANGSGKTTLLKLLAGIMPHKTGEVALQDGLELTDILFIGHNNALKLELTVLENLMFWTKIRGEPMLLSAAVNHMGLQSIIDTPCRELSAGWRRRVCLAKLICCPSKIWLLDEPTANLDAEGEQIVLNLIKARLGGGGGVIAAMHHVSDEYKQVLAHSVCIEDFVFELMSV